MFSLIFVSTLFLIFPDVSTLPLLESRSTYDGSRNSKAPSGWVDTPNVRGTFDILFSSLVTLSLCAWTAYHPNVPPDTSFRRYIRRRFLWMLIAVFAPEVVLFCASTQWWLARRLMRRINKLGEREQPQHTSNNTDQRHSSDSKSFKPWTMEQAFFVISGGLAVHSRTFHESDRLTFTPTGVYELARAGLLPNISKEDVDDKSKVNVIAKVLVCIQALWFGLQCIARLIQGLPLSLLEVHVASHILCAFGMYLLWIKKPYDAESPILSNDDLVIDMACLFSIDERVQKNSWDGLKVGRIWIWQKHSKEFAEKCAHPTPEMKQCAQRAMRAVERLKSHGSDFESLNIPPSPDTSNSTGSSWADKISVDTFSITRFRSRYIVKSQSNWHTNYKEKDHDGSSSRGRWGLWATQAGMSIVLSAVYGGVHLAAWNAHFSSTTERWFWRAAAITITAIPGIPALVGTLGTIVDSLFDSCWNFVSDTITVLLVTGQALILALSVIAYPVARLYIFAESFASLRAPEKGVYDSVQWSGFIPHAGG